MVRGALSEAGTVRKAGSDLDVAALDAASPEMTADQDREREALVWAETLIGDVADEDP